MIDENMKTFRQDNFTEPVIPGDLQDVLKWTEVDQRIVDTMKAIVTQYAAQVDAAVLDECSKVAVKFGIAVDEERLAQALTDAQKFYCEGYRAGKAAAMDEIVRCKDCKHCSQNTPDGLHWCEENEIGALMDDDFCSYGERRADDAGDVR